MRKLDRVLALISLFSQETLLEVSFQIRSNLENYDPEAESLLSWFLEENPHLAHCAAEGVIGYYHMLQMQQVYIQCLTY